MTIRASSNFATLVFKQVLHSLPLTRQPYFEIIVHFLQFFDLPHRLRSSRRDQEPEYNRTEYKLNLVVNSASNGATKQQAEQEQRQQHLQYVSDSGPDPAVRFYSVAACDPWHIVVAASLDFPSLCVCRSVSLLLMLCPCDFTGCLTAGITRELCIHKRQCRKASPIRDLI